MPRGFDKIASIALFRSILLPFVRVYWRPRLHRDSLPLPDGPCLIYGNHSNRWDPFILNCFSPWGDPTAGVMTQEFFRKPFLSWALRSLELKPTRKRIAEPHLIREVIALLEAGRKVVIYPEGGSRWSGRPEPWIEATAKFFMRSGVPVYPVVMHGSYTSWPRWADYPRPGRVEVEIREPFLLQRDEPVEDVLNRLAAPIDFDESRPQEHLTPRRAYRPACGIQRLLYRDPETGDYDALFTDDGTHVLSRSSDLRWKMMPDSRLLDETSGRVHETGDLHHRIRKMPLKPDPTGAFIRNRVDVSVETEFPRMNPLGPADVTLYTDAILVSGSEGPSIIPLESVMAVDIERNFKLQLFQADRLVQFAFTGIGSAPAWKDALMKLMRSDSASES